MKLPLTSSKKPFPDHLNSNGHFRVKYPFNSEGLSCFHDLKQNLHCADR